MDRFRSRGSTHTYLVGTWVKLDLGMRTEWRKSYSLLKALSCCTREFKADDCDVQLYWAFCGGCIDLFVQDARRPWSFLCRNDRGLIRLHQSLVANRRHMDLKIISFYMIHWSYFTWSTPQPRQQPFPCQFRYTCWLHQSAALSVSAPLIVCWPALHQ